MALTQVQKDAIKADILANGDMNTLPANSDSAFEIARLYALPASPNFYVWSPTTSASDIFNAITWKNLTPADAADGTALFTNRALACQAKQINIQILLQGQQSIATGKTSIQTGLKDALQNIPAGVSGALLDAGWNSVKAIITQKANRVEKLLATGTGTTGSPADLGFSGTMTYTDVKEAMGW